jgi:hypothetical protein
MANSHKGDLDDLIESVSQIGSVGQVGVQSEVWNDNQVANKINLDVNIILVNNWIDYHINNQDID